MTCGLDQHIAVYPRELADNDNNAKDDQGTLWKLLHRMEMLPLYGLRPGVVKVNPLQNLWDALGDYGFYVAQDGILRFTRTGEPVDGRTIREVLTPGRGCPTTNDQKEVAERWIRLFHDLFNDPRYHRVQVEYGKEHLVKRTKRRKINLGKTLAYRTPHQLAYNQEITSLRAGVGDFSLVEDLALCVYQANSVNAPAVANKALKKAMAQGRRWPWVLIYTLGNSKYGRWDDDLKNGRYQRTRAAARASGLWPRNFFDGKEAIMPKDLPG
jgi:hypothetical protein